jgi:Cellulose binding domain
MDPASQHGTSSPHARPSSGRARRSLGRLVVTPTFAAGACILFAAILAYGTTQTHLAFRGLGPACAQASCSAAGHPRPRAAGAPGRTFANGSARAHAAPDRDANPNAGRLTGNMASIAAAPGLPVVITYRTVRRWHGGFAGMMTITNRSRSAIPSWLLFVHYRRARMDRVWGARWYSASTHVPGAGVLAPQRDRLVLRPGASAKFTFRATGHFGPPAGCFFDAARCRFHPTRRVQPLPARGTQRPPQPARTEHGPGVNRRGHGASRRPRREPGPPRREPGPPRREPARPRRDGAPGGEECARSARPGAKLTRGMPGRGHTCTAHHGRREKSWPARSAAGPHG